MTAAQQHEGLPSLGQDCVDGTNSGSSCSDFPHSKGLSCRESPAPKKTAAELLQDSFIRTNQTLKFLSLQDPSLDRTATHGATQLSAATDAHPGTTAASMRHTAQEPADESKHGKDKDKDRDMKDTASSDAILHTPGQPSKNIVSETIATTALQDPALRLPSVFDEGTHVASNQDATSSISEPPIWAEASSEDTSASNEQQAHTSANQQVEQETHVKDRSTSSDVKLSPSTSSQSSQKAVQDQSPQQPPCSEEEHRTQPLGGASQDLMDVTFAKPQEAPLERHRTASDSTFEEAEDKPGQYIIIHDNTFLSNSVALPVDEDVLEFLPAGSVVTVVEVVRRDSEKRVRGRLETPAGWISLLDCESGYRWASRIQAKPKGGYAQHLQDDDVVWQEVGEWCAAHAEGCEANEDVAGLGPHIFSSPSTPRATMVVLPAKGDSVGTVCRQPRAKAMRKRIGSGQDKSLEDQQLPVQDSQNMLQHQLRRQQQWAGELQTHPDGKSQELFSVRGTLKS